MSESPRPAPQSSPARPSFGAVERPSGGPAPANLADILERVLDKGIVIAGDIRVNLLDIELLTIRIRLLVVSVDKAAEMGIDWWRTDPMLSSTAQTVEEENRRLRARVDELEGKRNTPESTSTDEEDADER